MYKKQPFGEIVGVHLLECLDCGCTTHHGETRSLSLEEDKQPTKSGGCNKKLKRQFLLFQKKFSKQAKFSA